MVLFDNNSTGMGNGGSPAIVGLQFLLTIVSIALKVEERLWVLQPSNIWKAKCSLAMRNRSNFLIDGAEGKTRKHPMFQLPSDVVTESDLSLRMALFLVCFMDY